MGLVQAEVTGLVSSGGDNYQYEIEYTVSGVVLVVDKFSSGGITGDLAIRDIVRNKCASLEDDIQRIGSTARIVLTEKIDLDSFEPKAIS